MNFFIFSLCLRTKLSISQASILKNYILKKIILFICAELIFHLSVLASLSTDSLKNVLNDSDLNDTNRINTHILLSKNYLDNSEFKNSRLHAEQALKLADKINFRRGIARSWFMLGSSLKSIGKYDSAIICHKKSLQIRLKLKNKRAIADCYNSIGDSYNNLGKYKESLQYFLMALKSYQEMKDEPGEAWSYCNIGVIYTNQNEFEAAIENYRKAIDIANKNKLYNSAIWYINNLAGVYMTQNNLDLADSVLQIALKTTEGNEINKLTMAFTYNSTGSVYQRKKNPEKALKYYKMALSIREEINDKNGVAWSLMDIGSLLIEEKKYSEAIEIYKQALKLASEIKQPERIRDAYQLLSESNFLKGDFEEAYNYRVLYGNIKDSILNESSKKIILDLKEKHKADVKDKEIKLLSKEKDMAQLESRNHKSEADSQKMQRNFFITGFICIILLAAYIFNRFRSTKKQKESVELHKKIVEEKNHEITQSIEYAKKIQTALLPKEEQLKNIFKESFILYCPKDIVSGDFYWFSVKEEFFYLATADCTGHGVPGGFMSMMGMSLLNEIVDELGISDCGQVLNLMRDRIISSLKQDDGGESKDGMDMVLIRINKQSGEMQYAAANNPILIIRNNEAVELKYDKMPVGVFVEQVSPFTTNTFNLCNNDLIMCFTDGYADQFGGDKARPDGSYGRGKKFKYSSMKKLFLQKEDKTMDEFKEYILNTHNMWKGDLEQIDDISIIGINFKSEF